jgi:Flp pilus assembly pilin Flp
MNALILRGRGMVVRMVRDENGVVSFEYLIVAACIVAAVAAAFGGTGAGTITAGLKTGITDIVNALGTAITAA